MTRAESRRRTPRIWLGAFLLAAALPCRPLDAVNERRLPLKDVIQESSWVLEAKVEGHDAARKRFSVVAVKDFKGALPFRRLNVTLSTAKGEDAERMLKRLRDGLPIVVFGMHDGGKLVLLGFSEGTWFSLESATPLPKEPAPPPKEPAPPPKEPAPPPREPAPPGAAPAGVCRFRACETYMRRTFAGATKDLLELLPEVLAGKRPPPAYDGKVVPGLGAELPPAKEPPSPAGG